MWFLPEFCVYNKNITSVFVIFGTLPQSWDRRKVHPQKVKSPVIVDIRTIFQISRNIDILYHVIAQFQEEVISGDRGCPCNIPDFKNTSTLFGFVGTVQNLSRWKIIYLGNVTLISKWPFNLTIFCLQIIWNVLILHKTHEMGC